MRSLASRIEALRQGLITSDSLLMVLRSQINQLKLNGDDAALAREMEALKEENSQLCTRVEVLTARLGMLEKNSVERKCLLRDQDAKITGVVETGRPEEGKLKDRKRDKPRDKTGKSEGQNTAAPETKIDNFNQIGGAPASDRPSLMRFLETLRITDYTMIEHPEVFTVEAMMPHLKSAQGAVGKNLFLKDKKKRLYLLTARHDAEVRLNEVAKQIGASGGLRLADETILFENLGVRQGCVNPYALANDTKGNVKFLIDKCLIDGSYERVNFHPMSNAATLGVRIDDFKKFLEATNHDPVLINL